MPQSLSKVYVHIIFSTKNRKLLIDDKIEKSLHEYLGGICKGLECNPLKIGGYREHVHVLCLLSRKVAQMKLVEELKKKSSKWIKTKDEKYSDFYWQDGYGIFSVNPMDTGKLVDYIEKQHEHHRHKSFQEEFRTFLKENNIAFDERYVWD
jgi:REP element-mobilizing transposase RayT